MIENGGKGCYNGSFDITSNSQRPLKLLFRFMGGSMSSMMSPRYENIQEICHMLQNYCSKSTSITNY